MTDQKTPDTFSLRPATEDDLPAILEIERLCYPPPCVPWTPEAFRSEFTKEMSSVLLLTDDATDSIVMAYIVFWLVFDECHILNLAVHPDWRGLELATRLVRQAINTAVKKDMKRVFLEVRKSNEAAVKLYQKVGFFIDHIKPRFYENGDDAYFMVRLLQTRAEF